MKATPKRAGDIRAAMPHARLKVETVPIDRLKPHPRNPRTHPEPGSAQWETMRQSLKDQYFDPLVWNRRNGKLVSGHFRLKVLAEMGCRKADVVVVNVSEAEHVKIMLRANRNPGDWDTDLLTDILRGLDESDRLLAGFDLPDLADLGIDLGGDGPAMTPAEARKTLAEKFGVPPFSVLDARQGYWQARKRAWLALGIQSELGRGGNQLDMSATMAGIEDAREREKWNAQRRASPRHRAAAPGQPVTTRHGNAATGAEGQ